MKSCIAILKDSFREALASRILLIALLGIVAVLLLLAPFGLRYEKSLELRRSEVVRAERILTRLHAGAEEETTPHAQLWSLMTDEERSRVDLLLNPDPDKPQRGRRGHGGSPQKRDVVNLLNKLVTRPDFYAVDSWDDVKLSDEATSLVAQTLLTEEEEQRRNLLLLISAFPRAIKVTDSTAISLTYAGVAMIESIPLTPTQFEPVFERILIEVIKIFLGFFGIFASLLFTAGLIPRTFEPGEIALLLSKPISRPTLFLTKFLGGCTFTFLYATVMVVGVWLLLGGRLGFWRPELLWCIPVYVFLFMIYFAVSAVAGAIWRNSIVALSLVVVFWVAITVIGISQQAIEENIVRLRGIKEITLAGEQIITVDGEQDVYVWEPDDEEWSEVFRVPSGSGLSGFARRFLAAGVRFVPVYDPGKDRILGLQQKQSRFGGFGPPELMAGYADDDWERQSLGQLPDMATTILVTNDDRIIIPTYSTISEFVDTDTETAAASAPTGGVIGNIAGAIFGTKSQSFKDLHPQDFVKPTEDFACALNYQDNALLIYDNGVLHQYRCKSDGTYETQGSRNFDTEETAVLTVAGSHVLMGFSDGRVLLLKHQGLETVYESQLDSGVLPRICSAAPDGSTMAMLTHDETVLLFDAAAGKPLSWQPPESGHCAAISYAPDGHLLVSDGRLAVRKYDLTNQNPIQQWAETPTWVYPFYDYVVYPAWRLLPKPYELDEFVPYVMTGNKSVVVDETAGLPGMASQKNLQQERKTFDAAAVARDNAFFVMFVLGFGCLIISRRDF